MDKLNKVGGRSYANAYGKQKSGKIRNPRGGVEVRVSPNPVEILRWFQWVTRGYFVRRVHF